MISIVNILQSAYPNLVVFMDGYKQYGDLLSGAALDANAEFIANSVTMPMTDISKRTDQIKGRRQNIQELEEEKKLGLFAVDSTSVNAQLIKQTQLLEKQILTDQLERNRELNRGINKDYEEIGSRLEIGIDSTNDLIETIEYFKRLIAEVQDKLSSRVLESQKRLDFLIKYAELAEEDYQLNAR